MNPRNQVDDLPEEPTEAECRLALFRTNITLRPFVDEIFLWHGQIVLSDARGEMLGQTTVKLLMQAGAQA